MPCCACPSFLAHYATTLSGDAGATGTTVHVQRHVSTADMLASYDDVVEERGVARHPDTERLTRATFGMTANGHPALKRSVLQAVVGGGASYRVHEKGTRSEPVNIRGAQVGMGRNHELQDVTAIHGDVVHFAEVDASLVTTVTIPRRQVEDLAARLATPVRGRKLQEAPRVEDIHRGTGVLDAKDRRLRRAARAFLEDATLVQGGSDPPRRHLAVGDTQHVLFATAPSNLARHLAEEHGLTDVPPDATNVGPPAGPGGKLAGRDASFYLECLGHTAPATEVHVDGDDDHTSAECFAEAIQHCVSDPKLASEVIALLDAADGSPLRKAYPNSYKQVAYLASAVGSLPAQAALARALLRLDQATPELATQLDNSEFHHTAEAMSFLAKPVSVAVDAVIDSLAVHSDRPHQYNQLLLALGSMGSSLPRGSALQDRIAEVLTARFDIMVTENEKAEAHFAKYARLAQDHLDAMGAEELYRWEADVNRVSRAAWGETWATASPEERRVYRQRVVDATARALAQNLHGNHDGYGLHSDYSGPARRVLHEDGSVVMQDAASGTMAALMAIATVRAEGLRFSVQALANLGRGQDVHRVLSLANHREKGVRSAALHALHAFPGAPARKRLLEAFLDNGEDGHIRHHAVEALAEWPHDVLHEDDDVASAVLRHLGQNDGMDWRQCEVTCTATCVERDPFMCRRSCSRGCAAQSKLEDAVVLLASKRLDAFHDPDRLEEHARRLSGHPGLNRFQELTAYDLESRYFEPKTWVRALARAAGATA